MKINNLLCFAFAFAFLISLASAEVPTFDYRMVKWSMCDSFNLSKYNCDAWWEVSTNPYWVVGSSNNSDYYNKSYIDDKFKNYWNKTEFLTLISSEEINNSYNKTEVDKIINDVKKDWLSNFSNKYIERDEINNYGLATGGVIGSGNSSMSDTTLVMIFLVVICGGIGLLIWNKNSQQKPDYNGNNYGTVGQRKIQNRNSMQPQIQQPAVPQNNSSFNNLDSYIQDKAREILEKKSKQENNEIKSDEKIEDNGSNN